MAIYHFSVKTISRKEGRSVVAAAAYRTAEKLKCDYYGKEQDYTKKTGVEFKKIYAPENTKSELLDRQNLWNEVEKVERRKDALLAREFEIAFPTELNAEQRKKLLNELCQSIVKKHGAVVDAAIHAPHTNSGSDERNYHAHILFTTRSINENGQFEAKKFRDFSRDNGTETVSHWRKVFADIANSHLKAAGHEIRIDHRSYLEQENGLESTKHEGPAVTALRRQYEREKQKPFFEQSLEIVMPAIAAENDQILERNAEKQFIKGLNLEIAASEATICDLTAIKYKKDAKVALEQKNALERKREQDLIKELEQATHRASRFHAPYQNFYNNFDENLNIDEQFQYVKNENAFELAKQYILDFELLQKHGLEPKKEKLSLWQKLKGEKEKEFIQIESVKSDLDNFFPILFNDYSNFIESKKKRQKEEEQQRIKIDQEERKRREEQQQKILELEKLEKTYNYSDNYDYGLECWITNHIGLELLYVYQNKQHEYRELSNRRYKEIERLYTDSTFRKNGASVPAEFVFESVLKLIESDKKVAKDFMPTQLAHIETIETKVKEYFKNTYEVKKEPINSYQKNHNYDLDNKPKPRNNNDFEM